ncbi:MAG: pyridoxal phosphate-dependent aminotransferase [Thermoprotei archaeon]
MKIEQFKLADWIHKYSGVVEYNLSSSGMSEPDLGEMGVDTSYQSFLQHRKDVDQVFKEEVANLYGVSPQCVIPTVGGSEAIYIAYSYLATLRTKICVPAPDYEPLFAVPRMLEVPLLEEEPETDDMNTWICLTDANNPTGKRVSKQRLEKVRRRRGVYVDETFRLFCEGGEALSPRQDNVIVSSSMTKFYGLSQIRIGWLVASYEIAVKLSEIKKLISNQNPLYSTWIALQALRNRDRFETRNKMIVGRNLRLVREFAEDNSSLEWVEPDGPPFAFFTYRKEISSLKLCTKAAEEAGVLIAPAEFFGSEKGFRLCFSTDEEEHLSHGLNVLSGFLRGALGNG